MPYPVLSFPAHHDAAVHPHFFAFFLKKEERWMGWIWDWDWDWDELGRDWDGMGLGLGLDGIGFGWNWSLGWGGVECEGRGG